MVHFFYGLFPIKKGWGTLNNSGFKGIDHASSFWFNLQKLTANY
jgi:hypothetical protein